MPEAARTTDVTQHGPPRDREPRGPTVEIGMMSASVGAPVESVSSAMESFTRTCACTGNAQRLF